MNCNHGFLKRDLAFKNYNYSGERDSHFGENKKTN
jgi:hypothetical protein